MQVFCDQQMVWCIWYNNQKYFDSEYGTKGVNFREITVITAVTVETKTQNSKIKIWTIKT